MQKGLAQVGRAQSLPEFDAYPTYNYLDCNFGMGQGTELLDKSPFHADGAITTAAWANGLHHRCLDFSPTPDYVTIPATFTHLDFTSEKFSIIARIWSTLVTGDQAILVNGVLSTKGYMFDISGSGRLLFRTFQASAAQTTYSNTTRITTETWTTIGVSRDGTTAKIYVNGADVSDVPAAHTDPVAAAAVAILGVRSDLITSPFDGKIEFLRIFGGTALPATAHLDFHNMLK